MADPTEQTSNPSPAGAPPPAPPPPPPVAPPAPTPVTGQPVVAAPPSSSPPGEVPDKDGFIRLPARDFKKRVGKATRKELREWGKELGLEFPSGTSSDTMKEALKARQSDYLRLKTAEEEQKRAQLTEKERYEADKAAAERQARHAIRRMGKYKEKISVQRWDRRIGRIAGELVTAEQIPEVVKILKSELRGDRKLLKRLNPKRSHGERRLREWFENKVKAIPTFAKSPGQAPPALDPNAAPPGGQGAPPPAPPGPMSHGAPPPANRPSTPREAYDEGVVQRMFPGKTMKAGQPNSLTSDEVRQVQAALMRPPQGGGFGGAGIPAIPNAPGFSR
jgi:hypothetical protein